MILLTVISSYFYIFQNGNNRKNTLKIFLTLDYFLASISIMAHLYLDA
jgi:hypothetical protein